MEKSILIGGFGGQGVQTMGKLLTYAAYAAENQVTFFPAYGGEMRGGASNCTVVISDRPIGSPKRDIYDYAVLMSIPAYTAFEDTVKPGGTMFVNSSLIKQKTERDDIQVVEIPLNDMVNEIGNSKTINIIMYGFLTEYLQGIPVEIALKTLTERLGKKKELAELNMRAFELGVAYAKKERS